MVGLVGLINKQLDDCCAHQLKMLVGKRLLAGWASLLPSSPSLFNRNQLEEEPTRDKLGHSFLHGEPSQHLTLHPPNSKKL